jgi:hypothetical protein
VAAEAAAAAAAAHYWDEVGLTEFYFDNTILNKKGIIHIYLIIYIYLVIFAGVKNRHIFIRNLFHCIRYMSSAISVNDA